MDEQTKKQEYLLSSVKNALQILQSFSAEKQEIKTSELAKVLGLGKSTISRLLSTLASEGFVEKNPATNGYKLGFTILKLGILITSNQKIHQEVTPILTKLVQELNETAHLVMLDHHEVIYIEKRECIQPVRIITHVGKRNPLHCTSSGKVVLAYQPETFIEEIIKKGLKKYTAKTITDEFVLKSTLLDIKEQGFSISIEEYLTGVCSIAAPIFDFNNNVVAAINIVGPSQRINNGEIFFYVDHVVNAAEMISIKLGYEVPHTLS